MAEPKNNRHSHLDPRRQSAEERSVQAAAVYGDNRREPYYYETLHIPYDGRPPSGQPSPSPLHYGGSQQFPYPQPPSFPQPVTNWHAPSSYQPEHHYQYPEQHQPYPSGQAYSQPSPFQPPYGYPTGHGSYGSGSAYAPSNPQHPPRPSPPGYPHYSPTTNSDPINAMPQSNPQTEHNSFEVNHGSSTLQQAYSFSSDISGSVMFVQLEIRAFDIQKKDIIGQSDPICYLQIPARRTLSADKVREWKTIDKTEVIRNNASPSWTKRFRVPYLFEQHQPLRFYLIDVDNFKTEKGDPLGMCVVPLANIVSSKNLTVPLTDVRGRPGNFGKFSISSHDENANGQVRLYLSLAAKKLPSQMFKGTTDSYFRLTCTLPGRSASSVLATSDVVKSNLNPRWKPLQIIVQTEGYPWDKVELLFTLFKWNQVSVHKLIGECKVSLADLTKATSLPLKAPGKKGNKNSTEILVTEAKAQVMPSFMAYIQGGLQLKFIVAVDFTASNKQVSDPNSLHYMGNPDSPSVYAQALHAVGTVVSSYLQDGCITALGFGARLPGQERASFDFSLSGQSDPRVFGVDSLLAVYAQATQNVKLSGPTLFTPLIRNSIADCQQDPISQNNQNFTVLLIITDGIITDLKETIEAIIDASYESPISIVIVGVGSADFSAMKKLDSDEKKLTSLDGRRVAKHDIVQFLRFDTSMSLEALAAEVLHEVPQLVVEFMLDAGIRPPGSTSGGMPSNANPYSDGQLPPMY